MDDNLDFNRWESAVGKVVISLSTVEGEMLLKYKHYLSKTKYFKASFNERLDVLHNLYNQECGENERANYLFSVVSQATDYRNLVAHNPVYADYSSDGLRFNISTLKGKPLSLDIESLEAESERIWLLCNEFSVLLRVWARN